MGVYTMNRLAVIRLLSIILFWVFLFFTRVPLLGNHKDVAKTMIYNFFNAIIFHCIILTLLPYPDSTGCLKGHRLNVL